MQHGERGLKIASHRALVAGPPRAYAGPEVAARPSVRPQNLVEEERRNIGEAGSESSDIGGRLDAVDAFLEVNLIAGLGRNASLIASLDVIGGVPNMTKPRGSLRSGAISSAI